jgi:hypothetical protein
MRPGTSSIAHNRSRALGILLGYNLPFALWTLAVLFSGAPGRFFLWKCPVHRLAGWCPGCGLTASYSSFLRGDFRAAGAWFYIVFAGFLMNLLASLLKMRRAQQEI